jgi:hypothetical protein
MYMNGNNKLTMVIVHKEAKRGIYNALIIREVTKIILTILTSPP